MVEKIILLIGNLAAVVGQTSKKKPNLRRVGNMMIVSKMTTVKYSLLYYKFELNYLY